jgi:hypothetical protein
MNILELDNISVEDLYKWRKKNANLDETHWSIVLLSEAQAAVPGLSKEQLPQFIF